MFCDSYLRILDAVCGDPVVLELLLDSALFVRRPRDLLEGLIGGATIVICYCTGYYYCRRWFIGFLGGFSIFDMLNTPSKSAFYTAFKKEFGLTPHAYRKSKKV